MIASNSNTLKSSGSAKPSSSNTVDEETQKRMAEMKQKYWDDLEFLIREFKILQERLTLEHQEFPPDTDPEFKSASRRTLVRMQYFLANVQGSMDRIAGKTSKKHVQPYSIHQLEILEKHIVDNILPVKDRLLAQIAAAESNIEPDVKKETQRDNVLTSETETSDISTASTVTEVPIKEEYVPEASPVNNDTDTSTTPIRFQDFELDSNYGDEHFYFSSDDLKHLSDDVAFDINEAFNADSCLNDGEDISDLFTPLQFYEFGDDNPLAEDSDKLFLLDCPSHISTSDIDDENVATLSQFIFDKHLDSTDSSKENESSYDIKAEADVTESSNDQSSSMFLGKREFQWDDSETYTRSKKPSRNSLSPILNREREVQYECSKCKENYVATMSCNPWWALVKHTCPRCNCLQAPRIDITLPANNVDHHNQILNVCGEDSDCGGDTDGGYISEDELEDDLGDGVQLDSVQAAKLLVLMGHARDCPGHHSDPRHSEVCSSTKFLMLHIRDCNGFMPLKDDSGERHRCPHSWCKPCRNLMLHLVKCPTPNICPICNPINLPKPLEQLRNLNKKANGMQFNPTVSCEESQWPFVPFQLDSKSFTNCTGGTLE